LGLDKYPKADNNQNDNAYESPKNSKEGIDVIIGVRYRRHHKTKDTEDKSPENDYDKKDE